MKDTTSNEPLTMTIADALHKSGLGRTKLYEIIKHREIKAIRVGRRRLIDYASLKAFLKKGNAK